MADLKHYVIRGGLEGRERLRVLGRVMHESTARDRTTLPAKVPAPQLTGLLSHSSGW